jgi:hypothetical protein
MLGFVSLLRERWPSPRVIRAWQALSGLEPSMISAVEQTARPLSTEPVRTPAGSEEPLALSMPDTEGRQGPVAMPAAQQPADRASWPVVSMMFEIQHGERELPVAPVPLALFDPYLVDPIIEANCPCVLEDMQAMQRASRPPERKVVRPAVARHVVWPVS